ncbi:MAG: alpha-L-fucosidase [Phycisphaerae bacterium]|nr:alpha-L-fucosidase [Gemmatimonadaceae bacterium]
MTWDGSEFLRRFAGPVPTAAQLAWQRDERALFLHFGTTTFTDKEWGDGTETPEIFNPAKLNARQWARTAKETGFPAMILTAKHHDGFCLWPTRTTEHSVASSPFRGGKGDVVREFVDACRAEGIKPGLYCSPWDRNSGVFGEGAKYNDLYIAQLTELLTNYGDLYQLWFDGANGEGPNGERQVYDWPRTFALVRKLQPNAIIFSDAGPDARWIGNDRGDPSQPNWSRMDPTAIPHPGFYGPRVNAALQSGHANGSVWRPGETDISIRPTWYHHAREDRRVKPAGTLVAYFFQSVGRNSKLLLNVPPNRDGLFSDSDVTALRGMHKEITELFSDDLTKGLKVTWTKTGAKTGTAEVDFGRTVRLNVIDVREDVSKGQSAAGYSCEGWQNGAWVELSKGTTIGYRALDRVRQTEVSKLRVLISDSVDTLHPIELRAFAEPLPSARLPR